MNRTSARVLRFPKQNDGAIGKEKITNRLFSHIDEMAASSEHQLDGGDNVEHNKLLEKYIDTVDRDRREMEKRLTENMRESESRTREEISQREQRNEELLRTYQLDNKEREERFFQLVSEIKEDNKEFKGDIKSEIEQIRFEISSSKQEISNLTKHNESLATTNKWSNIATIIGISAIFVTVLVAFVTIF